MNRQVIPAPLSAALLSLSLLGGCALPGSGGDADLDRVEQARQELKMRPLLHSSRVTVAERDGVIVFGGSVDSLQDLNIVRDLIAETEASGPVKNDVVLSGDSNPVPVPEDNG